MSRSRVAVVDSIVLGSRGVEFPLLRKPVPRTRGGDPVRVEGVLVEVLRVAVIVEVLGQVVDSIVRAQVVGGLRRRAPAWSRTYSSRAAARLSTVAVVVA